MIFSIGYIGEVCSNIPFMLNRIFYSNNHYHIRMVHYILGEAVGRNFQICFDFLKSEPSRH